MTIRNLPKEFDDVGRSLRTTRIAERSIILGRTLILSISGCIAIDAIIRFPSPLRWLILLGLTLFIGWLFRRQLLPVFAPASSRVQLALEVEKRNPQASGRLASGVEFAADPKFKGNVFAQRVERDAIGLVTPQAISGLLSTTQMKKEGGFLGVVMVLWIGFFVFSPTLATTGILRTLTPWVAADWPARTGIRSTTFATHHPKQTAVALKADLFRGNPEIEPVWVHLRRIAGENIGAWEKIPLIHQGETRFERLIEAGSDAVEFQFMTRDVETNIQRIDFVEAPTLASFKATVTPPQYATQIEPQTFELGNGTNNRGRIPIAILEGSMIEVDMLPTPTIVVPQEGPQRDDWIRSTFNWSDKKKSDQSDEPRFVFTESNGMWHIGWRADQSRSLTIRLTDDHGVQNVDDIQVVLDVAADLPPEALITEPSADETVLATARIPLKGLGRDDVGLDRITLQASRSTTWRKDLVSVDGKGAREVEAETIFDLSTASAQPGEVFEIVLVADDVFRLNDVAREGTRSNLRRIRVLTRPQFEEETRNTIAAIRQSAIRTNERHANLMSREESPTAQVRPQTEISERISTIRAMMDGLEKRLDRNEIQDDATRSLIEAGDDILETAQKQSETARNDLQEAAQMQVDGAEKKDSTNSKQKTEDANHAQAEVRSELDDLAALLDKDKDSWMAARKLEKVAEAISQSEKERTKAGAKTLGRSRQDLSADESANLDRAAESAKTAAQAAREIIEELKQRAEKVQKEDPTRAENLRQAAERGDNESLAARMDQAEQATRENRLDEAQQSSASAQKTVQKMIEDLADDEKARTETLRRRLATLVDALEQLVRQAESTEELGLALVTAEGAEATKSSPAVAQQAATLSLNASSIADEGRAAGPSVQRVVRLIERGAEAEGRAASALSAAAPQIALGHESLVRATALFKEALELVRQQEKKNDEQERQQRAKELAQAYKNLCDREEGLLTATATLVNKVGDRRVLVESRRLGVDQESIRQEISAISEGSPDVQKSPTFTEATILALDAATRAASDLRSGPPTPATVEMETEVMEILRGLVNALSEAAKKSDDPFADPSENAGGGDGAGGGGGGGEEEKPLIPPLAELKVIRSLQQRIYERTKAIESTQMPPDALNGLSQRQDSIAKIADDLRKELEKKMAEKEKAGAPVLVPPEGEPPIKLKPEAKEPI